MKLLLTSNGISNPGIHAALVDLLGKPVAESNALIIPTAIYPFAQGPNISWQLAAGKMRSQFTQIGWKSLGILELSILPSIEKQTWQKSLEETDALLVFGGDPLFLAYWLKESGLAELLPALLNKVVYVGISAGSMAACSIIGETYTNPPARRSHTEHSENIIFTSPQGELKRTFAMAKGMGLTDFAIIPHFQNPDHPDACMPNAEKWASLIPGPVYAIDDQTAIKVKDSKVELVSEGQWKLFGDKKD